MSKQKAIVEGFSPEDISKLNTAVGRLANIYQKDNLKMPVAEIANYLTKRGEKEYAELTANQKTVDGEKANEFNQVNVASNDQSPIERMQDGREHNVSVSKQIEASKGQKEVKNQLLTPEQRAAKIQATLSNESATKEMDPNTKELLGQMAKSLDKLAQKQEQANLRQMEQEKESIRKLEEEEKRKEKGLIEKGSEALGKLYEALFPDIMKAYGVHKEQEQGKGKEQDKEKEPAVKATEIAPQHKQEEQSKSVLPSNLESFKGKTQIEEASLNQLSVQHLPDARSAEQRGQSYGR
jgi:hypothetical protein